MIECKLKSVAPKSSYSAGGVHSMLNRLKFVWEYLNLQPKTGNGTITWSKFVCDVYQEFH